MVRRNSTIFATDSINRKQIKYMRKGLVVLL